MKRVPGFDSQTPQFAEIIYHLALIAGVFLIISGIAGIQASNTAKAVIRMIGGAGAS